MKILSFLLALRGNIAAVASAKVHVNQLHVGTISDYENRRPIRMTMSGAVDMNENSLNTWRPFSGIMNDVKRRGPSYASDWKDGIRKRTLGASLFLYFACLAPVVAFGGIASLITEGDIGVIEFILSSGFGGIIYALFSGQPMTFVGPTGLTLAFMATLFRFSKLNGLPFLAIYSWTGIWTSLFLALSSIFNLSNLVRYCTRFTDDSFNALLSITFIYEAVLSLARNFIGPAADSIKGIVSLNAAAIVAVSTNVAASFKQSKLFNSLVRKLVASFGPSIIVILMSLAASNPSISTFGMDFLSVPKTFSLATMIARIPNLNSVSTNIKLLSMIPGIHTYK